jgi:hypothetical protein
MKIVYLTFALLPLFFICGCSDPGKRALDSFKPIITYLSSQTNNDGRIEYSDFTYNVEKTDSLVSPFTGLITFKKHTTFADYTYTCSFADQNNKWVLKSIDEEGQPTEERKEYENAEANFFDLEQQEKARATDLGLIQLNISVEKDGLDAQLSKFLGCPAIVTGACFSSGYAPRKHSGLNGQT